MDGISDPLSSHLVEENQRLKREIEKLRRRKGFSSTFISGARYVGMSFLLGKPLEKSIASALESIEDGKSPTKQEVSDVLAHVVWRVTRIGLFSLLVASAPLILLVQQNALIDKQNELVEAQLQPLKTQADVALNHSHFMALQNELLARQNELVEQQTRASLMQEESLREQIAIAGWQSELLDAQNELAKAEIGKVDKQNELLARQNDILVEQGDKTERERIQRRLEYLSRQRRNKRRAPSQGIHR